MSRHRIISEVHRHRSRVATLLAIAVFGLACGRDQEQGTTEDVLGRDTTLARNLAMANTPGADGLSEEELEALVASQPPQPSWLAVAAQLDRNPPRPAQRAAAPPTRTDQPAAPARAQSQARTTAPDSVRVLRTEADTGAERTVARAVSPETSATTPRVVSAGPEPRASRVTETMAVRGCASPALDDQRACLVTLLADHDAPVNSAYSARIDRLRREAGARPGDPDPPSVRELREVQIRWLIFRDRECRRRTAATEGTLWAPPRADCLGLFSTARAWELGQA